MGEFIDKYKYLSTIEKSVNAICFDRTSGKRYSFEKLYYPLTLDDGKNAFQSYKEQVEQVKKGKNEKTKLRGQKAENKVISDDLLKKINSRESGRQKAVNSISKERKKTDVLNKNHNIEEQRGDVSTPDNQGRQISNNEIVDEKDNTNNSIDFFNIQKNEVDSQLEGYGLFPEDDYSDKHSLSVYTKRVLAIANAGYGKTTLLKRVALFYCYVAMPELRKNGNGKTCEFEEHSRLKKIYGLDDKSELIPCYIPLKKFNGRADSFEQFLCECLMETFADADLSCSADDILEFVRNERDNLLLLIDGLDELSSSLSEYLLSLLKMYLDRNIHTSVMMTSRVAGITSNRILELLRKMKFIGRAISPLTDDDAEAYALKWIEETQEGEMTQSNLKKRLADVLSKSKYDFIKEFMRTPLELLVILKQLANDSLSLDRHQLFHDILFELFTSHERVDKKRIFEDTMSVLGCIAYQMQIRGSLYISENDLNSIISSLNALNYHSEMITVGNASDYINFLESIAMNVGIVEKEQRDGQTVYTFPIRSYQEYLTAHACCHLVVNVDSIRPEPFMILSDKIFEDDWTRIIIFALGDLYTTNESEFEKLIEYIFNNESSNTRLCSYIESDLEISKDQAQIVCERFFKSNVLTEEERSIILSWSGTKSAYAYNYALKNLFMKSTDRLFVNAYAFSIVIDFFMNNNGEFKCLLSNLKENSQKKCILGATIVSESISLFYEEVVDGYSKSVSEQFELLDEMIPILHENAKKYRDISSIKAIVDVCIVRNYSEDLYQKYLDVELRACVTDYLYAKEKDAQLLCIGSYQEKTDGIYELLEAFTILGSFPVLKICNGRNIGFYLGVVLKTFFELSKYKINIDQTAMTVAMFYCICDYKQFIATWTHDICKEKELDEGYRFVRKDYCSKREQAHFKLLKRNKNLLEDAKRYLQIEKNDINKNSYMNKVLFEWQIVGNNDNVSAYTRETYINEYNYVADALKDESEMKKESVFSLFRKRDILGAAEYCIENLDKEGNANLINLAFLLRYGKIRSDTVFPYSYDIIPELLFEKANDGEKYAIINLALYYLENGKADNANFLFRKLDIDAWRILSYGFWKQELWDTTEDPEGALVCVLAHQYGRCDFDEYEKMMKVVEQNYADMYREIRTRFV